MYATAAMEDVTTTLLTEEVFAQEPRTLRVPFRAGSISSAWHQVIQKLLQYAIMMAQYAVKIQGVKQVHHINEGENQTELQDCVLDI